MFFRFDKCLVSLWFLGVSENLFLLCRNSVLFRLVCSFDICCDIVGSGVLVNCDVLLSDFELVMVRNSERLLREGWFLFMKV